MAAFRAEAIGEKLIKGIVSSKCSEFPSTEIRGSCHFAEPQQRQELLGRNLIAKN